MKRMRKERKGWGRNRKGLVINPKLPQGRLRKCGP